MENLQQLPQRLDGESLDQFAHRAILEAGGAFALFSQLRDLAIAEAAKLQKLVEGREPTPEEKQLALKLRSEILGWQADAEAAYKFEEIIETGDRRVN